MNCPCVDRCQHGGSLSFEIKNNPHQLVVVCLGFQSIHLSPRPSKCSMTGCRGLPFGCCLSRVPIYQYVGDCHHPSGPQPYLARSPLSLGLVVLVCHHVVVEDGWRRWGGAFNGDGSQFYPTSPVRPFIDETHATV